MRRSLILAAGCALLIASLSSATPASSGSKGTSAHSRETYPPNAINRTILGTIDVLSPQYPHHPDTCVKMDKQRCRDLLDLRDEGMRLRQADGGTLMPEHRDYLQSKLDNFNSRRN